MFAAPLGRQLNRRPPGYLVSRSTDGRRLGGALTRPARLHTACPWASLASFRSSSSSSPSSPTRIPAAGAEDGVGADQNAPVAELIRATYCIKEGIPVVQNVSLALRNDEIVSLVGQSGSGKSTILRLFAGLIRPTSGEVFFCGQQLEGVNPRAAIVFQNFALFPWLTVVENVMMGLDTRTSVEERRRMATQMVDLIGLDGYENAFPKELSGGQRQRVGFARALVTHPTLLLLDEPFSALDVLTTENLRSELLSLWMSGSMPTRSILMVTHGIEEAVSLADRIVVLGKAPGHIRAEIPVMLQHPRDRKSDAFQGLVDRVYQIISDDEMPADGNAIGAMTSARRAGRTERFDASQRAPPPTAAPTRAAARGSAAPAATAPPRRGDGHLANTARGSISSAEAARASYAEDGFPMLPPVRIGSVAGLLLLLASESTPVIDLYRLGQSLQLDVDGLYPIVEASEILGLLQVSAGDVSLTDKGHAFVAGSVDERKRIVRETLLVAPDARLIQIIYRLLQQAKQRRIPESLILDTVLDRRFSPSESRRQLDTAIEWGRYAELFAYDSVSGDLFLEEEALPPPPPLSSSSSTEEGAYTDDGPSYP
ncbi:hypothetical protein CDCA_CDCA04G1341 [Cyanidium caldarium]|uniref:Probable ATP-dependent transporter ycf16 n=1 Tax=Cyanidium caldarium TaxID=2771 RepID=A0AAV9ITC0_CYACA|nr:hypothetical protein CDCA_CDCA04G1341 [Cyanidium caldarium]